MGTVYFSEKSFNKIAFLIIAFILGPIGVDRFIRGQGGIGFLKLIITIAGFVIGGFALAGFIIFWIVDLIIAITKFGKYKNDFIFREGFFCKHCKIMESWTCCGCGNTGNTTYVCTSCVRTIKELECSLCHNTIKYKKGFWWPEEYKQS